jgi:UDP-glucose 4-epimerase
MRLLVTGGAGYIGSVVAAELLDAGHDVVVLDDLSTGHRDAVPVGADLVEAGLRESEPVLARGFDAVLHFAAKSLVGESTQRPELYWDNNVGGTLALLEAMRRTGVGRLVFSSTASVYGEPERVPIDAAHPVRPTNPYGASKLAVDHMLASFANAHGLAATSLRYFNVAGARGAQGERHAIETHLIPNAIAAATAGGTPLSIFGRDYPTPDGTAVRDYIHVLDLADAHLRALDAATAGEHRVYNLGTGTGSSVLEVVHAVGEITGREVPVHDAPRRAGDPAVLVADGTAAERELGWRPIRSLHDMVADAVAFAARN